MILITGGMGFIGLHTAKAIIDAGEDVVVTRYRTTREPSFLKDVMGKRFFSEQADVADAEQLAAVAKKYNASSIIHAVAPAYRALSPAEDYRTNMSGLINVLETAAAMKMKRVSIASSLAVYRALPAGPFKESALLPITGTDATEAYKKAWEILSGHYGIRTGLDVIALRIAGIYGPLYHSMANVTSRMVHPAVKGEPGPIAATPAQVPYEDDTSDFCYVKDCAAGMQKLHMADKLNHKVYNVASGRPTSARDIASAIRKVIPDAKFTLNPGKSAAWRENAYLDIERARTDVGYSPRYTVDESIADYIDWLRAGNAV